MKNITFIIAQFIFIKLVAMPTDSINRNPIIHFTPTAFFGPQQYSGFECSFESTRFKLLNDEASLEATIRIISSNKIQDAMYKDFGWDLYGASKGASAMMSMRVYPRKRHDGRDEDYLSIGLGLRKAFLNPSQEYFIDNGYAIDLNDFPKNYFVQNETAILGQFTYGQRFCLGPKLKVDAWAGLRMSISKSNGKDHRQYQVLSHGYYDESFSINPFVGVSIGIDTKLKRFKWE